MPKRYIEATEAIRVLSEYYHQTDLQKYVLAEAISQVPTVDVVEVKHGKWVNHEGLYQSSCCKHIWSELWWVESCPMERMYKIMPFCPSCGADMRKETEDAVH